MLKLTFVPALLRMELQCMPITPSMQLIGRGKSEEDGSQLLEKTIEAIQIKTSEDTMNLDSGLLLPSV